MQSREQEIMMLFEGSCPQCSGSVEAVGAAGKKSFTVAQPWVLELPSYRPWNEDRGLGDGMDTIGSVNFECENGHKHYVEYSPFGDWV